MDRRAGQLEAPPAMVRDITEWVQAVAAATMPKSVPAEYLRPGVGELGRRPLGRKFPVDLTGWRYLKSARFQLKKLPADWKFLPVMVEFASGRSLGSWDPRTRTLTIRLQFRQDMDKLAENIRHELQHWTQSFMAAILAVPDNSLAPRPGMSSRRTLTPQHSQAQQLYDDRKTFAENYLLDDVEFHPQLTDLLNLAQRAVEKMPSETEQREYLQGLIDGKEPAIAMDVWKRLAPGKWRRAVGEFYRTFPVLATRERVRKVAWLWSLRRLNSSGFNP